MKKLNYIYNKFASRLGFLLMITVLVAGCTSQKEIESTEGFINIDGADIYYKTMGQGEPIFILHGGPGDSHETMLQLKPLADTYKLIFYDQRAAAKSSGDEDTASHSIEQFVEDLEQLRLKLAPEKINLVGGSWGTLLGLNYAMKYPEHTDKLVLMSCLGYNSEFRSSYQENVVSRRTSEDSTKLVAFYNDSMFTKREPATMDKFWRIYFRAYCYNPENADSLHLWFRDSTYVQVPGRYIKLFNYLGNYDLRPDLHKIKCPTHIIYGDYDATPIEWIQPINDSIAESQLTIIENAGHWVWVEAPDKVNMLIRDFLSNE